MLQVNNLGKKNVTCPVTIVSKNIGDIMYLENIFVSFLLFFKFQMDLYFVMTTNKSWVQSLCKNNFISSVQWHMVTWLFLE